ncbi:MAG: threonine synthase [Spirochaetes bacterium]|nr:threonine synthase [Spirochaetota bacterium]
MKFISTRNINSITGFRTAIFTGLAPDGGLYNPMEDYDLGDIFNTFNGSASFKTICRSAALKLFSPEIEKSTVESIIEKAFTFSPKVHILDKKISLLELFHGPTCAFKDFGAAFLAASMEELLSMENRKALILVATSGDTGGAVARAFFKKRNIDVVILYPSQRVSPLQEKQLTTLGHNITALEVKGSFDDCQRMAKEAFLDRELKEKINLTSANSINPGRLIPQSFYYMFGYIAYKNSAEDIVFCVPSGNFGNLTAGILAHKWGMPASRYIAATNVNDVVPEYLKSGLFIPRASITTLSNAMDVGNPSNFERLKALFNNNNQDMNSVIHGEAITDSETIQSIREVYERYGILIDPHTAVGYRAARNYLLKNGRGKILILATAHPGKFTETVYRATGIEPEVPDTLKMLMDRPKRSIIIDPSIEELKTFIFKHFV